MSTDISTEELRDFYLRYVEVANNPRLRPASTRSRTAGSRSRGTWLTSTSGGDRSTAPHDRSPQEVSPDTVPDDGDV